MTAVLFLVDLIRTLRDVKDLEIPVHELVR
ncbi:hypothetical protein DSM25559_5254 [Agrobacterium rosae]|uniref:Uncharacterized protein n=1 Tax=Agrobacterium rosae TaxID=1972867 RepID=A0A1R3U3C7_9HYPH|nr:hypothetical protein DSM25559_5254 [Agrobacterium rosae]